MYRLFIIVMVLEKEEPQNKASDFDKLPVSPVIIITSQTILLKISLILILLMLLKRILLIFFSKTYILLLLLIFFFCLQYFPLRAPSPLSSHPFIHSTHKQLCVTSCSSVYLAVQRKLVSSPGWNSEVQTSILTLLSWRQANVYRFSVTERISALFIRRCSDVKPNTILFEATWTFTRIS